MRWAPLMPALTAGLLLAPSPARAQADAAAHQVPPVLMGSAWYHASDCPDDRVMRLEFLPDLARVNGMDGKASCIYAGLRQITPTRWYIDLECTKGRRVQLDINALSDGRLLVALRPLGEACFYAPPGR